MPIYHPYFSVQMNFFPEFYSRISFFPHEIKKRVFSSMLEHVADAAAGLMLLLLHRCAATCCCSTGVLQHAAAAGCCAAGADVVLLHGEEAPAGLPGDPAEPGGEDGDRGAEPRAGGCSGGLGEACNGKNNCSHCKFDLFGIEVGFHVK